MKYGILGTGAVPRTIANKLIESGHEVMLGSRSADNSQATEWANLHGKLASHGTFADVLKKASKKWLRLSDENKGFEFNGLIKMKLWKL